MQASRRIVFSLIVALLALSAPSALPAQVEDVSQSVSLRSGISPLGNCQTGSICGG